MLNKCSNNDEYGIIKQLLLLLPKSSSHELSTIVHMRGEDCSKIFEVLKKKMSTCCVSNEHSLPWTNESNLLVLYFLKEFAI